MKKTKKAAATAAAAAAETKVEKDRQKQALIQLTKNNVADKRK